MAKLTIMMVLSIAFLAVYVLFRKHPSSLLRSVARLCAVTVVAVVLVFGIIRPFVLLEYVIPSKSMMPTLLEKDHIFVNEFIYRFRMPRHGEVIVFAPPEQIKQETDEIFVKRVIGLPGDLLMMKLGYVYRNGERIPEPYVPEQIIGGMKSIIVPKGSVFVMGDNRNDSDDSRDWGPLPIKNIRGRATVLFFPLKRLGFIR